MSYSDDDSPLLKDPNESDSISRVYNRYCNSIIDHMSSHEFNVGGRTLVLTDSISKLKEDSISNSNIYPNP